MRNNLKAMHFYQVTVSQNITLLASVAGNELRFAPLASGEGVVVSTEEADQALSILDGALAKVEADLGKLHAFLSARGLGHAFEFMFEGAMR